MSKRTALSRNGKLSVREFLWTRIRDLKTFTAKELIERAPKRYKLDVDKARYYLGGWEKAGYLSSVTEQEPGNQLRRYKVYTLKKDTGINPPRVDSKGKTVTAGLGREQMWRTMRMIGQFTYQQLAGTASTDEIEVSPKEAATYVSLLYKAGYLHCVKAADNAGGLALYMLKPAAWTGSKPPMIKRTKVVFDQNTHQIVWPKDEDIESEY